MKETKFIEQNREKWLEYERLMSGTRRDPDKLNELFVKITDDLSYARTFYPNRSVRMYLNSLAQRIFHNIYRGKRLPVERFRQFWTDELPHIMWAERRSLWLSFALFVLAFSIGVVSSRINPDFARIILGDDYVEMTLQNIEAGDPMGVYKQHGPLGMTVGIAANNLFVALRTALLGVLASIGTVFILLYNGIMVGAFQYFFVERGVFWESFLTIWVHGTLEISAIIIAGAAGLVAGSGLLFPGTYSRFQAFQISMRRGLKIFFGLAPMLLLAAFFEGFLTRYTETPDAIRGLFILTSLALVLWYFVWMPWHKSRTEGFKLPIHDKELPPDRRHVVYFNEIKSSGEILADTFVVLSRHPRTVILGILGMATAFVAAAWYLFTEEGKLVLGFSDELFGAMNSSAAFFDWEENPGSFGVQMALLALLGVGAFRALERELDDPDRPALFPWRVLPLLALLTLPLPAFAWVFQLEAGFFVWALAMVLYPFLALWSAIIYFETLNPFLALTRAFSLMRWGQGVTLGFLTMSMSILFFLFLDSGVWDIVLRFFSWLVPSGGDNMQVYLTLATAWGASAVLYATFLILMLSHGVLYFSLREIEDAAGLRAQIDTVGQSRQIKGLARE